MQKIGWLVLFVAVVSCALEAENKPAPCSPGPKNWTTYADHARGFCFAYPSIYQREHNKYDKQGVVTLRRVRSEGRIYIAFEDKPFDLQGFVKTAPTGYDSPPEARKFGPNTFYYYGAGGGGVSYPDQFFYNLRGKTLYLTFAGPYPDEDKSPTAETKEFEQKILASFKTY